MHKVISQLVIAIDGHSSCGKSTVARDIAAKYGLTYIDTGAMYRAVTLFAIREGFIVNGIIDAGMLKARLKDIKISFGKGSEAGSNVTWLNSQNVEVEIRSLEVSNLVSAVSALAFVREHLVKSQQEMGSKGGVVLDGRDIGTVVFPNADLKIFMTASPEIRAKRRFDEMVHQGFAVDLQDVIENVKMRDHLDSTRSESPLKIAGDALVLDNSYLTRQDQLSWVEDQLRFKGWLKN